jgi:uncharacterized delta-60 repeat protein
VQPDGKILVAGFATSASEIDSDFALARYNPDGTLDTSFGTGGIVTADHGTRSDDARALAIQPDGKIVLAGSADEDIGLARYMPNGSLDPTFGSSGRTITDLGFEDVANGVALTSTGGVVVAGQTIGTKLNNESCSFATAPTAFSTADSAPLASSRPTSAPETTSPRT